MAEGSLNKNNVYIRDDDYGWIPARLVSQDETTAKVAIPVYESEEFIMTDGGKGAIGFKSAVVKLKDYPNHTLPLQNTIRKDGSLVEVEDMVDLPCLHEAAILYNLKARHVKGLPYCRIGDIIIAVNPYQWLTELYDKQAQQHYAKKIVWEKPEGDPRTNLSPHIYELTALCYRDLVMKKEDQSILVCGESGAGKTESAKICINHIALVQRDPSTIDEEESLMVRQILDSNPLLEAFGNAKTRHNENASRFSRYTTLQFNHLPQQDGGLSRAELVGSMSEVFLLEKSRVVYNEDIERTFHVFYQLVAAPNDAKERIWKGLVGKSVESFKYLGPAPEVKVDGLSDAERFQKVADMLSRFGIVDESYLMLYRAICACLQLGNLEFAPEIKSNEEKTTIISKEEFTTFCELIGCDEKVMELAFTERTIKTRGEEYKVPLKHNVAKETADAFAKEIYAKTFLWLVRSINDITSVNRKEDVDGGRFDHGLIGVLDIFGFESFPVNGFEQLCINYCNEKLQYKFVNDIFISVIEEYKAEGLSMGDIKYDDNSNVIDLIEGKVGLIKQLNEECAVRRNANDTAFVSKTLRANLRVPCLFQKRTFGPLDFGIRHYAGPVGYRAEYFVVRNTHTLLSGDVKKAAESCTIEILSKHLSNNLCTNNRSGATAPTGPNRSADTVLSQLKNQLNELMSTLEQTKSRYIRCIKPNTVKRKLVMQHTNTLKQLRAASCGGSPPGSASLFRSTYPSKLTYAEVKNRYYDILTEDTKQGGYSNAREEVEHICDQLLKQFESAGKDGVVMKGYAVGKTNCYFNSGCLESLEAQRALWSQTHEENSDTKLSQPTVDDPTQTGKIAQETRDTDEATDERPNSNSDTKLGQPSSDDLPGNSKPSSESFNNESATHRANDMAQVALNKNNVYIRDDDYGWIPARLVSQDETTAKVAIPTYEAEEFIMSDGGKGAIGFKAAVVNLKDYPDHTLPLQNTGKDGSLVEFEDMVDLPCLHEAAILYNLKARHVKGLPYCRIGDIIIAVNPYQWLTDLYDKQAQQHYAKKIVWEKPERDPRTNLAPHIYELTALCYRDLVMKKEDQSILVCGESGAGKTESAKICINHIALVQRDPSKIDEEESLMVRQILDSNPLLETFGNAKTRRNDNATRFGRYTTLQFNHLPQQNGGLSRAELVGSMSEVFLLEKSRVVYNEDIERTFHSFYQLVAAPNDAKERIWNGLVGKSVESFKYLGPAPEVKVDGLSDAEWFQKVADMLSRFGIVDESYLMLYRAICACLQLGNLEFAPDKSDDEKTTIISKEEFTSFCELIGCDEKVMELAFTERTIKTGGEEYKVPLKYDDAKATTDAFAKEIYAKTFLWLVRSINDVTSVESKEGVDGGSLDHGLIGILDIFGFQSFPANGFEVMCMNYCNEKLQYKFIKEIISPVMEEYEAEGLSLPHIRYDDPSDVIGLIEGKLGLIKQLNEECVRPKGNDTAFVSKALKSNRNVPCLIQKRSYYGSLDFGIHHYAGPVVYRAHDFVVRNNDSLPGDVKKAAGSCANNEILSKHLSNNIGSVAATPIGRRTRSSLSADTVMTQLKNQLDGLIIKLEKTKSRYIRCIKPNTVKRKLVMQHITTLEQLRTSACVGYATLFRSAYPSNLRNVYHGADVNIADEDGWTMLMGASCNGHNESVKLLLEMGADVTAATKNKRKTALMYASQHGHNEIVKLLLEMGADSKIAETNGSTALMHASDCGHNDSVKLLVEKGADVTSINKEGETALTLASKRGHNQIVKFLLEKGADITTINKDGETALTLASKRGHNQIVKFLLEKGADITTINKDGETALTLACDKEHNEIVKLLLKTGADVTGVNKNGETLLIWASLNGHNETVELLLEKGADVTASNEDGSTALILASERGHNEIVKLLLDNGADVAAAGKDGSTALILASERGHNEIVKLLVAKGADVTASNENGNTALSIAFDKGYLVILGLLLEKDPNISNNSGKTLLHLACLQNQKAHVQKLLEVGINRDILDNNDHTALFYAAEKGYADISDLLMKHKADGDKTDERSIEQEITSWGATYSWYKLKDGRTPLFIAAENGHQNVVAVLLQHGADPYLCNHENKIPADVSKVYGPVQQLFRIHDFFDEREKGDAYERKYMTCIADYYDSKKRKESIPPLEDIIHDIVKYPHFADKFFELYQENREIVNWRDEDGRTVRQVACRECREVTFFMGQYDMDDQPMYESPTCKIYNGLHYGGRDEPTLKQPIPVAMKMMESEEHYLNEIRARRKDDGSPRFSSEFVTPYLAAYRADEHPEFAKARETWNNNGSKEKKLPDFFIPMERGGRNLLESMNAENLSAEHKDLQRREILLTLVKIFVYLHEVGYIHGDIKPHNVVRHVGDSGTSWKAIDFDACTKIGDVVGLKLTTGSAPPEMMKIVNGEEASLETGGSKGESKVILRQPGGDLDEDDLVKADPSFDVWSFGILMYQLVTGRSFFHSDLQGNVNEAGLQELAKLTQRGIDTKLESVEDAKARDVLQDILLLDPKERPTMSKIEQYSYFHPSKKESDPKGPLMFQYTSTSQVIPKSVTKLIIGEDIQEITKGACSGNGQLEEVDTTTAHSLKIVGEKAFSSCRALKEFQCPSSVKAIGFDAFHECVKLQDFTFSKAQALELIADRAFYGCRALTTFKCPTNIKVIGKHAFFGCQSLRDVDLSEAHALESIEGRAFSFCAAVQKVAIPKNVTVVGEGFLHECDALESLVIAGENPILHINVLLRLPETKRELISMSSIVEMYSANPVKKSELSGETSKVANLLHEVKEGYVESIKRSDDPIRKISKRNGWVQFLSAHANDSKEDCIQKLTSFLENEATISVVRMLADATDPLDRVAKMIAPEHIRKVFEKRLFFLGRYDIAKGPPIHRSATCMVMKAKDAQMSDYYKEMFDDFVQGRNTVDKDKFTEVLQKMKLISYSETNIKELFHKVDVDKSGTVSKEEFVDFCMAELGHDVVLKFMRNKDQYRRELNGRDGLDPRFVVGCIRNHDTSTNRELIISLQDTMQSQEEDSGEILEKNDDVSLDDYCCVIVMPFGDRNLATISQSERPGPLAIRKMMQEVGEALCHLHKNGIVHGDLKMLNVVRSNGRLSLIDLDASGRIGKDFVGSKFSSGVLPPEMLYKLKNVEELDAYKDYISKGGSKGEREKREAVFTRDMVERQCFVVRSFWEKEVRGETNVEWTGETLTTVKSVPILDGLPYATDEARHHQSSRGSDNDGEGSNVLVRAAPSFDVWSFGVLLYRLLTRDPLFHVNDEDDIKKGYVMKHLYQWSDRDLKSIIESDVADPHARQLLQNILRSDPSERWTMAKVLNHDYFKVDLVKNMKEVHEKLSRIEKISLDNHHLMIREFARVHSSLQQIQRFQVEANKLLGQIMDGQAVPRYFLILPQPDSIDVPNKMTFVRFRRKVKDATNPDTYIKQPARLCFICPLSLQPVVDASGQAICFDIEVPQDWVRKYGPALLIGMKVAQVAMSVGRCFGLPLPSLSGAEDALAERSEVFSKLQEMVVSGLGKEGEDEEGGTIADCLISSLTDKLEESVSKDIETSKMIRKRLQDSYDGIEKLIPAEKDIRDCGLIEATYVNPETPEDCISEYVHPEWKDVFVKLGKKSLEMSMEELEMEKAKLDSSLSTSATSRIVESKPVSNDIFSTETETGGESKSVKQPSLGETTLNQRSSTSVYADEVVEEVSMSDSNIPEFPNHPKNDRLHGKMENMEHMLGEVLQNQQQTNVERMLGEVLQNQQETNVEQKLDKMDTMEHKLDKVLQNQQETNVERMLGEVLQNQHMANSTSSTTVENSVVIFHGWLSKQSREHSYRWQDRYFEIFNNGDVAYYPKGVHQRDLEFGVKLFQRVQWSKIAVGGGRGEDKLELKSSDGRYVLATVRDSKRDTLKLDEWLEMGKSWMERNPSVGFAENERNSTSSKPRASAARITAAGSVDELHG